MNPLEFDSLVQAERELWWFRGMNRIMLQVLDPIAAALNPDRVLEAGCGTGYFARLLEDRYHWKVFPSDLSWTGLSHARGAGTRRLSRANIATLPFKSKSFDMVVSLDVLVHFPRGEEGRAIGEFRRVLADGGLLVMRVSALDVLRSRHSVFTDERQRFTRRRLTRLVEDHGFSMLRCTYANSLLVPVALARFRLWEPLLRKPPASGTRPVFRVLDRLLCSALALEARWIGAGRNFPVGQSLILLGKAI
jgi:SAM-dependent methyltransferase